MMGVTHEERDEIRKMLSTMAEKAEKALNNSFKALFNHDVKLAKKVIADERHVNTLDSEIDQHCIALIALKQPMARDLRLIISVIKATSELERIADLCANISERTISSYGKNFPEEYKEDMDKAREIVQGMIRNAIQAFVSKNKRLALDVILRDEEIDKLNIRIWKESYHMMTSDASSISKALMLSYVSKSIERIADHATNIAEMVIYIVEGRIVRHVPPEEIELEKDL